MRILQRAQTFLRLPTDVPINPEVRTHFKGNFINNAVDGIIWMVGESFVSVSAILPVFASTLTSSAVLIGLVPALINAGWFLPQLLMAGYVQRLPQKMPFTKAMAIIERIPYLILPLTAFLLRWIPGQWAVALFMFVMAWRGLAAGLCALPWQEVIAIVIPSPVRSRFFGLSRTVGRLLGVAGSAITAIILASMPYPDNYAVIFLIGAIFMWISYFFFARTREPACTISFDNKNESTQATFREDVRNYRRILKQDPNMLRYLLSRIIFQMSGMAMAFFAVFSIKQYQLADEYAAIFSGLIFLSGTLGFLLLGIKGDDVGPRKTLLLSDGLGIVVLLLAFLAPGLWSIYLIFLIIGFAQSGYMLGDLIFSMELGPESDRAIYMGLTRTLPGFIVLFAPLVGGMVVERFGYRVMFFTALIFAVAAFILLLGVKDRSNRHLAYK